MWGSYCPCGYFNIMYRNIELDRLRAFAVLMTVYAHIDFLIKTNWVETAKKYANGSDGVILFFVISGYIISSVLIPILDNSATSDLKKNLYFFWIKRITRIMPMAVLWLCLPLLGSFIVKSIYLHYSIYGAIAAFFNVYNIFVIFDHGKSEFGIYWSLSLEEQFYIIFPVFLLFFKRQKSRILSLIIFSLLLNFLPSDIRPSFRCEGIIYGIILYLLSQKYNLIADYPIKKFNKLLISVIILGLLLCVTPILSPEKLPAWLFYPISPFISVVLVWLALKQKDFIFPCKKLENVLDWLGTRSYGIYLIHITIFKVVYGIASKFPSFNGIPVRSFISLTMGIFIVEICYRFFETPLREWGRCIAKKNKKTIGLPRTVPYST